MKVVITNGTTDLGVMVSQSLDAAGFVVHAIDTQSIPRWLAPRAQRQVACIDAADPRRRQEQMLQFIASTQADLFLPLCTQGVRLAVERREELNALCRCLAPDAPAFSTSYDKRLCMKALEALGIPCAESITAEQAEDLLRRGAGHRVIVKPALDVGGAQGLRLVDRAWDLPEAIATCTASHGACLIQEFIPGSAAAMRSLTVVFDQSSRLVGAFALQKLRHSPATGGNTGLARSRRDGELLAMVLPFFQQWRWRGPAEVEAKWDARMGLVRVIEINPRFPGTLRLSAVCGLDLPLLAARAATGEELAQLRGLPDYQQGVTYLAPTIFARSVAADASPRGCRNLNQREQDFPTPVLQPSSPRSDRPPRTMEIQIDPRGHVHRHLPQQLPHSRGRARGPGGAGPAPGRRTGPGRHRAAGCPACGRGGFPAAAAH